ncbi:hypothetical protein ACFSUJ_12090 [Streptomyces lusitanus]|uniref:Uncharacterized protein n=1 Tax=Streptomyces lusitanus TaxID=68232 RepID=A0ABU3JP32_9ACTN|nr:hypothetical protein [Streptomyces lusitanus]
MTDRARTHIKAMIDALKEEQPEALAQPAGLFTSGMLTGLAASAHILDGSNAEAEMERVGTNLAAAIGIAYLNGTLPTQPAQEQGALVDWQSIAQLREAELRTAGAARHNAEQERDGAYRERAHLVALLAAMTDGAVIAPASDVDEPGWQIVYLRIGGRQASWHISPADADLFADVEHVATDDDRARWDGHTTDDKYARIRQHTRLLFRQCGPACAEAHTYAGRCESARPHPVDDSTPATPDLVHPDTAVQASAPQAADESAPKEA